MMSATNLLRSGDSLYAHLSEVDPSWSSEAQRQKELDAIAQEALNLPILEFRALGYKPPPLPKDAPIPNIDIRITVDEVTVKDGTKVGVRIYKPIPSPPPKALLFYNVHGGGYIQLPLKTKSYGFTEMLSQVGLWAVRNLKKLKTGW